MSEHSSPSPTIRSLSQALTALGAYAEEPADAELATAEQREGEPALRARLSNALYGNALARTLDAEVTATDQPGSGNYRRDAWAAAGADNEGVLILQHYTAMRLTSELAAMHQRVSASFVRPPPGARTRCGGSGTPSSSPTPRAIVSGCMPVAAAMP